MGLCGGAGGSLLYEIYMYDVYYAFMIKCHRKILSKRHFLKKSVIFRFVQKTYIYTYINVYMKLE